MINMFDYKRFTLFNFDEGVPYVSLTSNGMTFNKGSVLKLGKPEYVQLMIDKKAKQILIRKCDKKDPNAKIFYKENKRNIISVRWNTVDLLNTIQDIMGWDLNRDSYKIEGNLVDDDNAILFPLELNQIF